ncbi:MAG TPA: CocE/NonD family hydrolase, partial [Candidatus Thermoplasmatota archaeon]|nr:CocE/NonD family hydrolase [Candidatus Thermoplasmatota archaeon]
KVGMIGGSYDGWTQLMAAANGAPHLAAIVPIAPVADWYHVVGKGGAKYAGWTPHSPLGYNFLIPMGDPATLADPERAPADPRLQRADDQACAAENQLWSDDLSGDYNDWMKARDLRPKAAQAKAPMLYAHGLVDMNARPDHVDPWYNSYGGPKRAWLWQMTHASPSAANTGRGTDWDALVLAWMDHHLLGLDNGINRTYGTVEVQDSIGRWRVETAWPPLDAAPTELPLSRGRLALPGQANATPAAAGPLGALPDVPASALLAEETATWQDTVVEDGGTLGTRTTAPGRGDAPGRLCFRSDPLPTDLHYAGRPVARVVVSSDRPQTLVVARLYQILPDGSWVLVNEGVRALAARDSLEEPQPGTPQTTYTLHVEMQPEDFVFRAGDAIGLVLSSSDASYVVPSGTLATNALHMGGPTPSALVLPAIERANFTAVTWGDEQPPWEGPEPWGVPR